MPSTARMVMVLLTFLLAALSGCGKTDPYGRLSLSGTVTFRGQPLDKGVIDFLPPDPQGNGARAMIQDGKYRIPREQGLPPGTYRVLIASPEANTTDPPAGPPGMKMPPLGKERIPARYNRDSQETVEVRLDADNRFDFTIE